MITWAEIARKPTSIGRDVIDLERHILTGLNVTDETVVATWSSYAPQGWHESLCRAFHIVEEVKRLLELETPPSVIRQAIDAMEA